MKCSVKLLKGKIRVSLNLKDIVITEPELAAGDVLWNLIKARREERVIRTVWKNPSRGAEGASGGEGKHGGGPPGTWGARGQGGLVLLLVPAGGQDPP